MAIVLPFSLPSSAAASQQSNRPPDAHYRGPPHTDVMDVDNGVTPPDHYVAPRSGWRYRPLRAGQRIGSEFYAGHYIIADPRAFGLPRPSGSNRWIRYGNDLMLIETGRGRVLRIVRNGYSSGGSR